MLLEPVNATTPAHSRGESRERVRGESSRESVAQVLAAYHAHQGRTGRGNHAFTWAAKAFLRRWPNVADWADEPLQVQLSATTATRPFITFLLVTGRLHPGWEYLVYRKFSSIWRDLPGTVIGADIEEFVAAARRVGYTERVASAMASQVMARVLFATGKRLRQVTHEDFTALIDAGNARQVATGRTWKHYRATATATKTVLYHLGVLPVLPPSWQQRQPFARRIAAVPEPMHTILVRYLERKSVTCKTSTVSGLATRLAHFGVVITTIDPAATPATMTRTGHIEPWMSALTRAENTKSGGVLSRAEQARRILAVANFLREITEWDWPEAPARTLMYASDNPRLPAPLPRFLPPDADRRLTHALQESTNRLPADALLLQRACGLRIGELLDLEMDAVIDVPGAGSWLKVPLGKLDTERIMPIDPEILTLLDRITTTPQPRPPDPTPPHRPARGLPVHRPRPTTRAEPPAPRTRPRRRRSRDRARHPPPAAAHLRHRPDQRRGLTAGPDGDPGARLRRNEPALREAVRHHHPRRIRTRPGPGQDQNRRPTPTPGSPHTARPPAAALERHRDHQNRPGRRALPARARPRPLPLRQHLRTLPQLHHRPRRHRRARTPSPDRRGPRRRRHPTRLGRRN